MLKIWCYNSSRNIRSLRNVSLQEIQFTRIKHFWPNTCQDSWIIFITGLLTLALWKNFASKNWNSFPSLCAWGSIFLRSKNSNSVCIAGLGIALWFCVFHCRYWYPDTYERAPRKAGSHRYMHVFQAIIPLSLRRWN